MSKPTVAELEKQLDAARQAIKPSGSPEYGNVVHQVLANYQWWPKGGSGWLRILTFEPEHDRIRFETFSPHLNRYRRTPTSQFALPYAMRSAAGLLPGLSSLQHRKLYQFFRLLDADRNDAINLDDVMVLSARFNNMLGLEPDDPKTARLQHQIYSFWNNLLGADANADATLTWDEFCAYWRDRIVAFDRGEHTQAILGVVDSLVDSIFGTMDVDSNGAVGMIEFLLFLKAMGVNEEQIHIFNWLDTDGNGLLSLGEVRGHVREFFLGDAQDAPSSNIFGKLPGYASPEAAA